MTTIAYKDGILASDSRETSYKSQIDTNHCRKIWRLKDGSLLGCAGDSGSSRILLEFMKQNVKTKPKNLPRNYFKNLYAIFITPLGAQWFYEKGIWMEFNYPYAIGSGQAYAQAVMDAGLSAPEAVKIAIKRDCFSGGRVQVLKLKRRK